MKLDEIKVKTRKGTHEKVRHTMRHEDSKHKSRSRQKRDWKREAREAIQ